MPRGPIVLITRPEPGATRFAKALTETLGTRAELLISPVLRIDFHPISNSALYSQPVFTSANGVRAWERSGLPAQGTAWCVGAATAKAAAALGFAAHGSGGTVEHLLKELTTRRPAQPLSHIHGTHTRGDLVPRLTRAGLQARGYVAYDQTALPLTPAARDALEGARPVIVPLFSPRSAAQFVSECPESASPDVIALSAAVAAPLGKASISEAPTQDAMLRAVVQAVNNAAVP